MEFLTALLLAAIQGLTEFVPISSSGHLAVTQYLLRFSEPPVAFDVVLHLGTLVAVLIFYRKDLAAMFKVLAHPGTLLHPDWKTDNPGKLMLLLILACIPTAVMGFLLHSTVEHAFSDMKYVGIGFLISGGIMILTLLRKQANKSLAEMKPSDALVIGTLQGVALFPGISRSGSTITAAILLGIRPELAGRFSFLLSIPAVVGAILLESKAVQIQVGNSSALAMYAIAAVVAGVIGYLSIGPLIRILRALRFHYFAFYCWVVGILLLLYLWQTRT